VWFLFCVPLYYLSSWFRLDPTPHVDPFDRSSLTLFCLFHLVSGIGHKIKSVNNPDLRVELVKEYVKKNFPSHSLLDYALAVEKVTTAKKDTVSYYDICMVTY
jgi:hypothetical protein